MPLDAEVEAPAWYCLASAADWSCFAEVRRTFPRADLIGEVLVFDLGHKGRMADLLFSLTCRTLLNAAHQSSRKIDSPAGRQVRQEIQADIAVSYYSYNQCNKTEDPFQK